VHHFPYLTTLVLLPAGAALLVLLLPKTARLFIRGVAIVASLGVLGIALAMLASFHGSDGGYQMVVSQPFATPIGASFTLGVDGISLFLVLLSAVLFPIVLIGASEKEDAKSFVVWVLLLEVGCLGSFLSLDLLMFFLFFETTLVPVYFLIVGWGYERRGYAGAKFFLYTFAGSALMLVGIVSLVFIHESQTGITTFDVRVLANTHLSGAAGMLLFLAFTAAFAVKTPIFPFHTWSPDAYRAAPSGGVVLLAAIMAKLGTYGIIRFDLGLFPHATSVIAPLLLTLGVIGILYGGIVAATQRDLKRLVAYSSLAHMGFIVLGAFALTEESVSGAVLQMVNHGVYTAALFLLIAMIYERRQTFSLDRLSGIQADAPVLAAVFTVVMLASIGVPGLNGFVGEFLILSGTFLTHRWWAVVATTGVIIAAVYLLWAYQQAFHRKASETGTTTKFAEMTWREGLIMAPLIALIIFLGVYPQPILSRITPSVDRLVAHVATVNHQAVPGSATGVSR
jgi:NADH-quinone oxidoreductase subunit M